MKIITIIGNKEAGKTTLFCQLVKYHSLNPEKGSIKLSPVINYTESLIKIGSNVYKLVDTPAFILTPRTEIEKGIKEQIERLLKNSGLICWVIDKIEAKEVWLRKYLRKFSAPQILIFNKLDLADNNEIYNYQTLWPQHFLAISALKGTKLDKLSQKIIELLPLSNSEDINQKEKKATLFFALRPLGLSPYITDNRFLSTSTLLNLKINWVSDPQKQKIFFTLLNSNLAKIKDLHHQIKVLLLRKYFGS